MRIRLGGSTESQRFLPGGINCLFASQDYLLKACSVWWRQDTGDAPPERAEKREYARGQAENRVAPRCQRDGDGESGKARGLAAKKKIKRYLVVLLHSAQT